MNLVGQRFNSLVVIAEAKKPQGTIDKHKWWLCTCDCGNSKILSGTNIKRQKSCGCARHKSTTATHGFASHKRYDKLYHTWTGIKYRCYNPKSKDFIHYGKRGIKMCGEWLHDFMAFREWALSHGFAHNLTIDRIDVNGDYCPDNCRWTTVAEQNRNKTTTKGGKNNDTLRNRQSNP